MPRRTRTAIAVAILLGAAPAQAQLISNGGFESGDFAGWNIGAGCSFTGVDNEFSRSGTYSAFTGSLRSTCTLSQSISTTAGAAYDFSFWLRNNGGPLNLEENVFSADWGGVPVQQFFNTGSFPFEMFTTRVMATGAATTVAFSFRNDASFWRLDDVAVTLANDVPVSTVPEPTSFALIAVGLWGLMVAHRRRAA